MSRKRTLNGFLAVAIWYLLGGILLGEDDFFIGFGSDRNLSKVVMTRYLPEAKQAFTVGSDKCVRLWDVDGWQLQQEYRFQIGKGRVGEITAFNASKNEKQFAVGRFGREGVCPAEILIVDKSPKRITKVLSGHNASITHLVFFDGDEKLLSIDEMGMLLVWDLPTRAILGRAKFNSNSVGRVTAASVNKLNQISIGTSTGHLYLLASIPKLTQLAFNDDSHRKRVKAMLWLDSEVMVSVADDGKLVRWDTSNRRLRQVRAKQMGDEYNLLSLSFVDNKKQFLAFYGDTENEAEIVSGKNRPRCVKFDFELNEIGRLPQFEKHYVRAAFCNGDLLTVCLLDSTFQTWDLAANKLVSQFVNEGKDFNRVTFDQFEKDSTKSLRLLWQHESLEYIGLSRRKVPMEFGFDLKKLQLFDTEPNRQIQTEDYSFEGYSGAIKRDAPRDVFALNRAKGNWKHFSIDPKKHGLFVHQAELLSPNVIAVSTDNGLFLFDHSQLPDKQNVGTQNEFSSLDDQIGAIESISLTPDDRYLATYSTEERSIAIRLVKGHERDPKLFAKLFVFGDEWALISPKGFYDCTPAAEKYIGWHVNGDSIRDFAEFHELDKFEDQFYRPSIFPLAWRLGDIGLAEELSGEILKRDALRQNIGPKIRIAKPVKSPEKPLKASNRFKIAVEFGPSGSERPVGVSLLVNDRPRDDYFHRVEPGEEKYEFELKLDPGQQVIAARCESQTRKSSVSKESIELNYEPYTLRGRQRKLFFLGVGINEYEHDDYKKLDFAKSDTRQIGEIFKTRTRGAFHEDPEIMIPPIKTKEDFWNSLDRLLREDGKDKFGQTDTLVIMWSGHGDVDNDNNFTLVLPNCDGPTPSDKSLVENGIPGDQLARRLRDLKIGHIVVILDTCYSGGAVSQFRKSAGRLASKANSDDYGLMVISACDADETSKENRKLGMSNFAFLLKTGLLGLDRYEVNRRDLTAIASPLRLIDGKKIVTTDSLVKFLQKEMPRLVDSQKIQTNGFGARINFLTARR